jgi:hypothetical protein
VSPRKSVEEGCTGSVDCEVENHVRSIARGNGRHRIFHIPLTRGQQETIHERNYGNGVKG